MSGCIGRRFLPLRLFFIFALAVFCFPRCAVAAQGGSAVDTIRISIPDAVFVENEACSLSEIADIDGPGASVQRAGELLLTIENGEITRDQVIEALRVSGLQGVRIELKMPLTVKIEKGAPALNSPTQEMGRTDLAELIKSLAAWDGEVEVQYQGSVPAGSLVSPASIVPGTAAATLKFRSGGRDRSLGVRLIWTQPVLVLTRSLKRGEPLKESDVTVRQIRINRPGVYASKFDQVAGRSARKNIPQGEALAFNLVADTPIIERGASVTIVARSGSLVVRTNGEAMESGGAGDTIRVRNIASRTVLSAVIVTNDTVEVEMP